MLICICLRRKYDQLCLSHYLPLRNWPSSSSSYNFKFLPPPSPSHTLLPFNNSRTYPNIRLPDSIPRPVNPTYPRVPSPLKISKTKNQPPRHRRFPPLPQRRFSVSFRELRAPRMCLTALECRWAVRPVRMRCAAPPAFCLFKLHSFAPPANYRCRTVCQAARRGIPLRQSSPAFQLGRREAAASAAQIKSASGCGACDRGGFLRRF